MRKSAKAQQSTSCVNERSFTDNDTNDNKLRELTNNLKERIKELNCLYGISRLIEHESTSLDDVLQSVVELIPASWQYPEDTCARIKLKDREFRTVNFTETVWNQTEIINVNGENFGTLDIYYLRKKPDCDEGPFLKEERNLIHAIAERLGHIAEHKFAESKLQLLYEQEKQLRKKLQAEIQSRVDLTRKLIHELKTPLTALIATSQLLLEETQGKEIGKLARYVWEGANNVNNRIDELHDTIRGEIGKLKLELKPLDINKSLRSLVEETHALSQHYEVAVNLKLQESIPKVYADPARFRQIMLNLLNNAFKYACEGKKIVVTTTVKSGYIVISVRDYGPGIAEDKMRNLFATGYQSAYTGESTGGLGLGLALCKILVELHGGKIWVKSKLGKGASFFFSLPISKQGENASARRERKHESTHN